MKKHIKLYEQFKKTESEIKKLEDKHLEKSFPISNNFVILEYINKIEMRSYENKEKSILQDLREILLEIFGQPNKRMISEFLYNVYILEYKDLVFNVFTAKDYGTGIEVCLPLDVVRSGIKNDIIIEFLEKLHKLINKK